MRLIIACDPNGGIGYKNKLPWHKIEGDLPRFKRLTENKIVVMGRSTWDSLPVKPLPNRRCYVITSTPNTISVPSVNKESPVYGVSIKVLNNFTDDACIIGGAKLIEGVWDKITEIHLTLVHTEYTCDTFIDLLKISREFTCNELENFSDHTYQIWKRK